MQTLKNLNWSFIGAVAVAALMWWGIISMFSCAPPKRVAAPANLTPPLIYFTPVPDAPTPVVDCDSANQNPLSPEITARCPGRS